MKIIKELILGTVLILTLGAVAIYSYHTYHYKKASRDILYQLSNQLIVKQGLNEKMSTHLVFDTLYVDGNISKNDDKVLSEIIENHIIPVRTISINSGGGDIETAINIGSIIYDKGISIEVRRLCLSSCANYLFPAARNKIINYGSIVGFHGSPNSDDSKLITTVDGVTTSDPVIKDKIFSEIRKTDKLFYNKIHVSWMMPLCGQNENIGDPDTGLSTYNEKDFAQFGVKNISYTDGEMVWKKSMDIMGIPFAHYCKEK
ncbi:TPA: hypothetical protein OUA93_003020 [Klebsiella variicola]|uniref:hypothetical protein n=1 Tax=Klebsiella variicola TaxID=244366 RepID=UPI0012ABD3BA|nr:hypothetical protein [Klebsiella variicola]HCT8865982.1 hypothetical protein [Klebsiella variicola]HED2783266.1 hypothetical protein [Klebsiella variicola subsp. variicola]